MKGYLVSLKSDTQGHFPTNVGAIAKLYITGHWPLKEGVGLMPNHLDKKLKTKTYLLFNAKIVIKSLFTPPYYFNDDKMIKIVKFCFPTEENQGASCYFTMKAIWGLARYSVYSTATAL